VSLFMWLFVEQTLTQLQAKSETASPGFNAVAVTIFVLLMVTSAAAAAFLAFQEASAGWIVAELLALNLVGLYVLMAFRIANQWEKAVVLRLGRFIGLRGPGPFWIVPIVDTIPAMVDHRVMVTPFNAEKTLTKDTVPVDVDAVLFWVVWDAEKAALEVEDYYAAISWAAQTALREIIGQTEFLVPPPICAILCSLPAVTDS